MTLGTHGRVRALGLALIVAVALAPCRAAGKVPEAVEACLECHSDEEARMEFKDGSSRSLHVSADGFLGSVHGQQLLCTDCHERYAEAHPEGRRFGDAREYVIANYGTCKKCHFDTYTRTLESVHYEVLKRGLSMAPVCTDCHGSHDIRNPHERQAMLSKSCAACHVKIYEQYAKSVHGRALVEANNQDVPACANCHTHHSIEHPNTVRFRLASPEVCVGCHGDAARMARYGIPTDVAATYLADFHGVTASLSKDSPSRQIVVTCIDCHGVHDMQSPRAVGSQAMKARVEQVCASCHQGASRDFPAAWLSHFRPSLRHAPLVFLVDLFYKIFIPFVVFGLLCQVFLHLYRVAVRR